MPGQLRLSEAWCGSRSSSTTCPAVTLSCSRVSSQDGIAQRVAPIGIADTMRFGYPPYELTTPIKPFIPPYRLGQGVRDSPGVGVGRVDQKVALQPRRNGGDDQERRTLLLVPFLAEGLADRFVARIPAGMRRGLENFIRDAVWN